MFRITLLIFFAVLSSSLAINYTCVQDLGGYCQVTPNKYVDGEPINFVNMSESLYFIVMTNIALLKIPAKAFSTFKLQSFDLSENNIKQITSVVFKKATNLEYLVLRKNNITVLKNKIFVNCVKLRNLDLSSNRINRIAVNAFYGAKAIETIDFSNNSLHSLATGTFDHMGSLAVLNIEMNFLKIIPKTMFQNNPMISYLYLEQNNIETIEAGAISQLEKLDNLRIGRNKLSAPADLLQPSGELSISSNILQTITISTSLTQIRMENNMIKTVLCSSTAMTIAELYGAYNSISSLGCIKNMTNLTWLMLSNNNFTIISKNMFAKLEKLMFLSLAYNPIAKITPTMFSTLTSLSMLDVDKMSGGQKIQAHIPSLIVLSLTTTAWNCSTLLTVVKVYNAQKVTLSFNTPSPGKKALCKLQPYEINKIETEEFSPVMF